MTFEEWWHAAYKATGIGRSNRLFAKKPTAKEAWNAALGEAIEISSSGELDPAILTKRIQELKA